MKKLCVVCCMFIGLSCAPVFAASQEVGKWNYTAPGINGIVTIIKNGSTYMLERSFSDGSKVEEQLIKEGDRFISQTMSGQFYTISDGGLKIFDAEGFIRSLPPAK